MTVLLETLRSFHRHLRTPFEVVIFSDNTTFPAARAFLDRLAAAGVTVHHNPERWTGDFNALFALIKRFVDGYMEGSPSEFLILSDPDCALDRCGPPGLGVGLAGSGGASAFGDQGQAAWRRAEGRASAAAAAEAGTSQARRLSGGGGRAPTPACPPHPACPPRHLPLQLPAQHTGGVQARHGAGVCRV